MSCVWTSGIIKEKINESFKVSFCGCAPIHASGWLTNMMQIMPESNLSGELGLHTLSVTMK